MKAYVVGKRLSYLLEVSCRCASNEYQNNFHGEMGKISILLTDKKVSYLELW